MTPDSETKDGGNSEKVLSFTDHLQELRIRIFICVIVFFVTFVGSFVFFAPKIVQFILQPLTTLQRESNHSILTLNLKNNGYVEWEIVNPKAEKSVVNHSVSSDESTSHSSLAIDNLAKNSFRITMEGIDQPVEIGPKTHAHLSFLNPLDPFFLWMQGAFLLSAAVTLPVIVHQAWLFISPGLLSGERRSVGPILFASVFLFPIGAGFAYSIMKIVLDALLAFGDSIPGLEPNIVASSYISFALWMMISFGLIFEFPLVLILLSRIGVIDAGFLAKKRKVALVLMSLVAAIATPSTDPFSMMCMYIPMIFLYEGSIYIIKFLERTSKKAEEDAGIT